jgi:hypothetical protein
MSPAMDKNRQTSYTDIFLSTFMHAMKINLFRFRGATYITLY